MAVKTIWTIDHSCGHQADTDLSDRPADRRAGYARWLATRDCPACWKASRPAGVGTIEWLESKRAAEQAEAQAWSEQFRMPPLEGTERAAGWAVRCRQQLITAAYTTLVIEGAITERQWADIEDAARTVTRAGWWLDQREADPADLPELLEAATTADRGTENPFR